jgi:Icc-related predicted phosphoesterase
MYGPGLVELIEMRQPALALSGHVHHPRQREALVGATRCVNVGYFKRDPVPFIFDADDFRSH